MSYPAHRIPALETRDLEPYAKLPIEYTADARPACPWIRSEHADCSEIQQWGTDELAGRVKMALPSARRVDSSSQACSLAFDEVEVGNRWWPWLPWNVVSAATLWILPSYWRDSVRLRVALRQGDAVVWQQEYEEVVHLWMGWFVYLSGQPLDGDSEPRGRWYALMNLARLGASEGASEMLRRGCISPEADPDS